MGASREFHKGDRLVFACEGKESLGEVLRLCNSRVTLRKLSGEGIGTVWTIRLSVCREALQEDLIRHLGLPPDQLAMMGSKAGMTSPKPSKFDRVLARQAEEACEYILRCGLLGSDASLQEAKKKAVAYLEELKQRGLRA